MLLFNIYLDQLELKVSTELLISKFQMFKISREIHKDIFQVTLVYMRRWCLVKHLLTNLKCMLQK